MNRLTAMEVFRRVVEREGFAAAARDLGLSKAAVSKNVAELESHLGVRLLSRTTRQVRPTDSGAAYYRRCVHILDEIVEADREAAAEGVMPRGLLRVAAPMSFGLLHLGPRLPDFLARHPEVSVDLVLNDRRVDLIDEGVDVALRGAGDLQDSTLVARRLATLERIVCAAPAHLAAHGEPNAPEDLAGRPCLIYSLSSAPRDWRFEGPAGPVSVRVSGHYAVNSSIALRDAAVAGAGFALLPAFVAGPDLDAGRLRAVLTGWPPEKQALYAVYVDRRFVSPKVRAFIDFLIGVLAGMRQGGRPAPPPS